MWLMLLTACWRPDPDLVPELPPLAGGPEAGAEPDAAPVGAGADGADGEGGDPEAGPDPAEPDAAEPDAAEPDAAAPEPGPEDPPFTAYPAYTAGAPVTLVDDFGKSLCIISVVGSPVEVRGEEVNVRKKVWSRTCVPAVEGWVQTQMITRRGELPPAAPSEGLSDWIRGSAPSTPELGPSGR